MYGYGAMQGAGGGSGYSPILGVSADGTNDYALRGGDLSGVSDGTTGMFVARMRFNGGDGVLQYVYQSTTNVASIQRLSNNTIRAFMRTSAGVILIQMDSTETVMADGTYYNIAINWDTSADAGNKININGTVGQTLTTRVSGTIDYSRANHAIAGQVGGTSKANADINFLYLNFAETMGFDTPANYAKFFTGDGSPVLNPYGSGSEATGNAPIMYFAGDVTTWHINKGTGEGFTVTGAFTRPLP